MIVNRSIIEILIMTMSSILKTWILILRLYLINKLNIDSEKNNEWKEKKIYFCVIRCRLEINLSRVFNTIMLISNACFWFDFEDSRSSFNRISLLSTWSDKFELKIEDFWTRRDRTKERTIKRAKESKKERAIKRTTEFSKESKKESKRKSKRESR
jgi:hypothetical protein